MNSSARELLKWIALVCMTCDHVAKVVFGGYVPGLSEAGRVAFPVFALVMACNLAQPGADIGKSVRRLLCWGLVAQPVHAWAFGYWVPLNVLLAFALAAALVWCLRERRWVLAVVCGLPAPLFVDYQWAGMALVAAGWLCFRRHFRGYWMLGSWDWRNARLYVMLPVWVWAALGLLCWLNGNGWALLALPIFALVETLTEFDAVRVPRTRWAFYGYYVGHLALLAFLASVA